MKLKHLLFSSLMLLSAGSAWADVEINETNFPDANFRNWVLRQSYGSDGVLTDAEIAAMKQIDVSLVGIQNLQGIEYFTALTWLRCGQNQLTSLDVSKNVKLTKLECGINQLTSLNLSGCTALEILHCYENQLTSFDVSKNTALQGLYCYENQLTSLDVSKNTALTVLYCEGNQLTSLDVSKNIALTDLGCSYNQLTSLDVSKNTALTWLSCYYNQLTSLDVSKNTALQGLYCYSNQLTSLDVSKNTELTYLGCYDNQLTSLDVSKNTALGMLNCFDNQLTSLDVSKNTGLYYLYCYSNQLTSLDVSKNTGLYYLYCYDNQLTSLDVSKNTALTSLHCYQNQIKGAAMDALIESLPSVSKGSLYILDYENEHNEVTNSQVDAAKAKGWVSYYHDDSYDLWLVMPGNEPLPDGISINEENFPDKIFRRYLLSWSYGSDGVLTDEEIAGVTDLNVSLMEIQSLKGIEYFTALAYLYCYKNQLTSLDVSGCTALKYLYCSDNQLTSLNVSGCTALEYLYCYKNQINGEGMDALVENLPKVMVGNMYIISNEDEQNEMMSPHVTAAKAKGWTPMEYNGQEWVAYAGMLPPMPDLTPEELLKIEMSSSDMSDRFIDRETKIQGSNVNVTKNIADTEYAVGSIQTADGKTHPYSYFYVPAASTANPNVGFYLPYNLKGEYDIYLVTMPTWTYQNNFDEEKRRYRFRASIWEKDEQNNFPSTGTVLKVDDVNTFETPEVDANVITDTTFIGTYDFQHAYTDYNTPGVILQINSYVLVSQRKTYSNSMIFAGVVLVSKDYKPETGIAINEENFPDANFRIWLMNQSYGRYGVLTDEEIARVTSIDVSSKSIQSLKGIEYFTALTYLNCGSNQLTSLDLSKNTALKNLQCYSNQLTSFDVSKNTALTYLNCSDNPLTSLDVSKNTALTELGCSNNQLTSLDVSKNTALTSLYCSENQLTSLDVSKNTALERLFCFQNQIKGAAMDALVEGLPTTQGGKMYVELSILNEQNVMTTTQVAAAKAKGWTPYYTENGADWYEYAGVDPSTGVNNVEAADADDSAPWYTINGVELAEKPTIPGIYIHGGKKVVVK